MEKSSAGRGLPPLCAEDEALVQRVRKRYGGPPTSSVRDRDQWLEQMRMRENMEAFNRAVRPPGGAPIEQAAFDEVASAAHRDARPAAQAPDGADLAEAQLGLLARCVVCRKRITSADAIRDRDGRARHRDCRP